MNALRLFLLAVIAAPLLSACEQPQVQSAPPRPVKTVLVDLASVSELGSFTGEIKSRTESDIGFRSSGKILARLVDVGSVVNKGDVLARMDDTNETNSVRIAETQLVAANAELQDALGNEARQRELLTRGSTTQANYDAADRRLKTAQANVGSAQVTLNDAKDRLGYTTLRADEGGAITAVGAQPGQVVSAGQMVVRLARTDQKEGLFNVSEQVFHTVPRDPQIIVSLLSNPDIRVNGRVREIAPAADPVTRTFAVRVTLYDAPREMRLGSAIVGRVVIESRNIAVLPPSAMTKDGDKPAVFVVDPATNTLALRPIDVLRYENDRVLVRDGLKTGERVAAAGVQKLRPGLKVRLMEGAAQ